MIKIFSILQPLSLDELFALILTHSQAYRIHSHTYPRLSALVPGHSRSLPLTPAHSCSLPLTPTRADVRLSTEEWQKPAGFSYEASPDCTSILHDVVFYWYC